MSKKIRFVTAIKNGWLHNIKFSVDTVISNVNIAILNEKGITPYFSIFHAEEVKSFIEKATHGGVKINILDNKVCSAIQCIINIDYSKMKIGEIHELKEYIKSKL